MEEQSNRGGFEMTELKTLEDMQGHPIFSNEYVTKRQIKQEAIKWVKNRNVRTTWSAEEFIEKFFKITEEDLK